MRAKHARREFRWPFLAAALAAAVLAAVALRYGPFATDDGGSGGAATAEPPSPTVDSSSAPDPEELRLAAETELQRRLDEALTEYTEGLGDANFYASVAVDDGEFHLSHHGDDQHESASIVKTEILAMMLLEYGTVDQIPDWAMAAAEKMIRDSDNDATNEIFFGCWDDPHAEIRRAHVDFGLHDTEPHEGERWGQTLTTANDQLTMLRTALFEGMLTAEQTEVARDLMGDLAPSQQWGVDAAAADGETVWMKNGWDTREAVDGEWVVNSIGVIAGDTDRPITIAVLTGGSVSHEEGIERVEDLARTARDIIDAGPALTGP
ncbi:serine hydrolase [Glycomyces terrestris]|uniref:Beta-lactamase class A catalytic domain-containing protein n=1 Tax=Glycomyces terrestris TaxID=2493553 RepID=A0A426V3V4_9ACTN|nr:serine hydrolase [Glycomyces terrestris]RRS01532.1 hypothetical protein EIW28_01825 [Glycomyces terrestris]